MAKSGKRKGRFVPRGARPNQLARVNLIIQARRAKAGLKGLYGRAMRQAEGAFKQRAQVAVGFLKSPFIPIIKGLSPLVKYRNVATRWSRIAVWPGSSGSGRVVPAKPGWNPFAEMVARWRVPNNQDGRVSAMTHSAMQRAFDAEGAEMMRHVAEKLQKEADRIRG